MRCFAKYLIALFAISLINSIMQDSLYKFNNARFFLSHVINLASFLWDIGKQNSHRGDTAEHGVPSGAILFAYMIFIKK